MNKEKGITEGLSIALFGGLARDNKTCMKEKIKRFILAYFKRISDICK